MRTMIPLAFAASALALGACAETTPANNMAADTATVNDVVAADPAVTANDTGAGVTTATANLRMADGREAGTATAVAENGGLTIRFTGMNLPAGVHGVHVHTTGRCDPPGFETAGGHWNPGSREHGSENPNGAHAGDVPNLTVAADGTGTVSWSSAGAAMSGASGLLDADGAAFLVHADPDDYRTDPSGNSGARIACGVFAAG